MFEALLSDQCGQFSEWQCDHSAASLLSSDQPSVHAWKNKHGMESNSESQLQKLDCKIITFQKSEDKTCTKTNIKIIQYTLYSRKSSNRFLVTIMKQKISQYVFWNQD